MKEKETVYEQTYRDYLQRLSKVDLADVAGRLGGEFDGEHLSLEFIGRAYKVNSNGFIGPEGSKPDLSVCVVLGQYILRCPDVEPRETEWVSFRDFPDAAPFVGAFGQNVERPLAEAFTGKPDELQKACDIMKGRKPAEQLPYQVSAIFNILPKVPVLLLFNDADGTFPAQCSMLWEKRGIKYIDPESMSIGGWLISDFLIKGGKREFEQLR